MRDQHTHVVSVEGVGKFTCRRRTMRTAIAITAEYNRLTEGAEQVPNAFANICNFLAYLKGMVIAGPDDWDPYLVDPDSTEDMERLRAVHDAIQAAEARFRKGGKADAEKAGEGTGGVD